MKKQKGNPNALYIVVVDCNKKVFSIVNRWRVIYNNTYQFLVKQARRTTYLMDNFITKGDSYASSKYTYDFFVNHLEEIKQKRQNYYRFFVLVTRKDYEDFKEKLFSLNSTTQKERIENDFEYCGRNYLNSLEIIEVTECKIKNLQKQLQKLEEEKAKKEVVYLQAKQTLENFYNKVSAVHVPMYINDLASRIDRKIEQLNKI